jgi:hypothetical protein
MPRTGVLVGVSVWRVVIAAFGFVGFGAAMATGNDPWPGLSQQASLLTGVVYLGLALFPVFVGGRSHEPRSPWLRGAMTVLLLLVSVTFLTIMGGDLDETWSLFEHLLTPLVVFADWAFVGRNQAAVRWWHPLTWVVFPLAYLVYFVAADPGLYGSFLDPDDSDFAGTVAGFLVAVVAAGYLLYGIAKLKTGIARANGQPPAPGPPPWHGQQPYPPGQQPWPGQQAPPGYQPQSQYQHQQPPGWRP